MSPEDRYVRELNALRSDVTSGLQCLYAWLAIHHTASKDVAVRDALNSTALFWNTVLGSLQATTFITMGRIFDEDLRNHSLSKLLSIISAHPTIFSRQALAARKRKTVLSADFSARAYAARATVYTKQDLQRIRKFVAAKRKIYKATYGKIRHQVFAHNAHGDQAKVAALFSRTKIRELETLLLSLSGLHETLWQQFYNGQKVRIRLGTRSVDRILKKHRVRAPNLNAHELVALEATAVLKALPIVTQQLAAGRRP
ncbi:MAG: hypothetical protein ACRERR_14680 [Moraxellaceae bacterium]